MRGAGLVVRRVSRLYNAYYTIMISNCEVPHKDYMVSKETGRFPIKTVWFPKRLSWFPLRLLRFPLTGAGRRRAGAKAFAFILILNWGN